MPKSMNKCNGPIVGFIPSGIPEMTMPSFQVFTGSIPMLIIHTVIIAFVGFMEAIAIAKQLYVKKPPKDQKKSVQEASEFSRFLNRFWSRHGFSSELGYATPSLYYLSTVRIPYFTLGHYEVVDPSV